MYSGWSSRESQSARPSRDVHFSNGHVLYVLVLENKFLVKIKPDLVYSLFLGDTLGQTHKDLYTGRKLCSIRIQANTKGGAITRQEFG